MLNLDETLLTNTAYTKQRDLYIRVLAFSLAVIVFVEILRAQVSEVNILQLIPGYYLILLLFSLVFLVVSSNFFNYLFISNDEKRSLGTKTKSRLETTSLLRFSVFLFFCLFNYNL